MDDMVLWHDDVVQLRLIHLRCCEFMHETLALELKPEILQRTAIGVDFLGCRIWPTHVKLNRRSKRRWRRRVRVLEQAMRLGLTAEPALQARLVALAAFASSARAKSWRFRQAVLEQSTVDGP